MLIEIEDPAGRAEKLAEWLALPNHVYVRLDDGQRIRPSYDDRQRGDDRLSSVQYLKFAVGDRAPVAVGIDLPGVEVETPLTAEQRAALAKDLADRD